MKVVLCLLICCLQQMYCNAFFAEYLSQGRPACITMAQLDSILKFACNTTNINDDVLWDQCIDLHRPMTDEFMRASGEAQCPEPKEVQNSNDTSHSIRRVFRNFCGVLFGNQTQQIAAAKCLAYGNKSPYIMSNSEEIRRISETWSNGTDEFRCLIGNKTIELARSYNIPGFE